MLTRRELLTGMAAAGAATLFRGGSNAFAKASQPATPVNFAVPPGACDTHTHIFGDPRRFPFATPRMYTPEPTPVTEQRALHRALHTTRVVIVQPSVYNTDNACTLDALRQLGSISRGIAVIDDNTPESALDEMDRTRVRGIRLGFEGRGPIDFGEIRRRFVAAVERIRKRPNWHIQLYTRPTVIESIQEQVAAAPMPIVFDHFGGAQASQGLAQPGFDALLNLVSRGRAYVKLSAPYRESTEAPDYPDMAPFAKALIAANPQRMLWGTDWPHPDASQVPGRKFTDLAPLLQIDDGRVLNQLPVWAPDAALRKTILVENPAKLYGF